MGQGASVIGGQRSRPAGAPLGKTRLLAGRAHLQSLRQAHEPNPCGEGRQTLPLLCLATADHRRAGEGAGCAPKPNGALVKLMVRAHQLQEQLLRTPRTSIAEVAERASVGPSYVTRTPPLVMACPRHHSSDPARSAAAHAHRLEARGHGQAASGLALTDDLARLQLDRVRDPSHNYPGIRLGAKLSITIGKAKPKGPRPVRKFRNDRLFWWAQVPIAHYHAGSATTGFRDTGPRRPRSWQSRVSRVPPRSTRDRKAPHTEGILATSGKSPKNGNLSVSVAGLPGHV